MESKPELPVHVKQTFCADVVGWRCQVLRCCCRLCAKRREKPEQMMLRTSCWFKNKATIKKKLSSVCVLPPATLHSSFNLWQKHKQAETDCGCVLVSNVYFENLTFQPCRPCRQVWFFFFRWLWMFCHDNWRDHSPLQVNQLHDVDYNAGQCG